MVENHFEIKDEKESLQTIYWNTNELIWLLLKLKKEWLSPTEWLEQVKEYWKILHIRFVYSSNGKETYEFDLEVGKWCFIKSYPTPEELHKKVYSERNSVKEILWMNLFIIG